MTSIRRLRRIIAGILIGYAVIGVTLRLGWEKEFFPIFTWDLFSTVPPPITSDFELKIININQQALNPPIYFSQSPQIFSAASSINASDLISKLGGACLTKNTAAQTTIAHDLTTLYLTEASSIKYHVVQRTYNILDFWRDKIVLNEVVVCEMER